MKLAHYLSHHQISISKFTKLLGLKSRATLYRYMRGERAPSQDLMIRIMQLTDCAVTERDFAPICEPEQPRNAQRLRWNQDCILSAKFNHGAIYDRDFYMQFLERSAANENITFPLWQALQVLKERLKIHSSGDLQLDGVKSTTAHVIAAANRVLSASGLPLIFYPKIHPVAEKASPNFRISF